ncbi:MAG: dienelactone hydrolase family protein, partial [Candidatus Binatia bacterium]
AYAPDLYEGRIAATIEEAEGLLKSRDFERMDATAVGTVEYLRSHPAVRGATLGVIGFSMGGGWAIYLSTLRPEDVAAVVLFYGIGEGDFGAARAAYLGHFAEVDEWEPAEGVRQMEEAMRSAGRDVSFYLYPGVGHWFFEDNRPDNYDAEASTLAWERTLAFLRAHLGEMG